MKRLFASLVSLFSVAAASAQLTTTSPCVPCTGNEFRCFVDQGSWSSFQGPWVWPNGAKYCRPKLDLQTFCPGTPNPYTPALNSMCATQYCCELQTITDNLCACVSSAVVWSSDGVHDGPWVPCSVLDSCKVSATAQIAKAQAAYVECFSNNPDPKSNIGDHGVAYCGHSFTSDGMTYCSDPMCGTEFPFCDLSGWLTPCSNNLKTAFNNARTAAINNYYACLRNCAKKAVFRFPNGTLPPNNETWYEPDNGSCGAFDGYYDPNEDPYWGLYYNCGQADPPGHPRRPVYRVHERPDPVLPVLRSH